MTDDSNPWKDGRGLGHRGQISRVHGGDGDGDGDGVCGVFCKKLPPTCESRPADLVNENYPK